MTQAERDTLMRSLGKLDADLATLRRITSASCEVPTAELVSLYELAVTLGDAFVKMSGAPCK